MILKFENYIKEVRTVTIPFDEDIKDKLKILYRGSEFEKTGIVDERVDKLLDLHSKWIENAKKHFGAEEIAKNLYRYELNLNK